MHKQVSLIFDLYFLDDRWSLGSGYGWHQDLVRWNLLGSEQVPQQDLLCSVCLQDPAEHQTVPGWGLGQTQHHRQDLHQPGLVQGAEVKVLKILSLKVIYIKDPKTQGCATQLFFYAPNCELGSTFNGCWITLGLKLWVSHLVKTITYLLLRYSKVEL